MNEETISDERGNPYAHHGIAHRSSPVLWGITDGGAGMENQVKGVFQALGVPGILKRCKRKRPWSWLPTAWHYGALKQLTADSDKLLPPWPAAVITSGRRSGALALAIKAASGGATKAIHLTDPRSCHAQFDLIVAMQHDTVAAADNVIQTRFAMHHAEPEALSRAAAQWKARFAAFPRPWVAVLIGGTTNRYTLTAAAMQQVIAQLKVLREGTAGSLLITPSRRTGEENSALLQAAFAGDARVFVHTGQGDNPYLALLALADHIVVTDDSVNMMSEACATGKPLYILPLPGQEQTRPAGLRFAEGLMRDGIARPLALPLATWTYEVVDEMPRVVAAIRKVLKA